MTVEKREMIEAVQNEQSRIKDYTTTVTILESIEDAVFFLNDTGNIQYTNSGAQRLLNYSMQELVSKCFDMFVYEESGHSQKLSGLIENLQSGIFENIESILKGKDGLVPVILNFSTVKDHNEKLNYIIVTAKNISQRKLLERKLKEQQAMSISKDRMRALGEMSVGVIHEIGQPLATLRLRIELLQSLVMNGKADKLQINDQCNELLNLIQRISHTMDHMRTFAQQTENDSLGLINLNDSIDNAKTLVKYELDIRNIELCIEKDKQIPFCIANQLLIDQVLINLINNSIDAFDNHTQDDGTKKKVTVMTSANNLKWLELSVTDNAGGMSEEVRNKIFDPFYTTKPPEENSGLGLAISKNIIHSLGGDISVSSELHVGTVVTIRLPSGQNGERDQLQNLIELLHGS